MQIFRWTLVAAVVLALVNPTEALVGDPIGRRRVFRDSIRNKKLVPNGKAACKKAFGIGCSITAGVSAAAFAALLGLAGTLVGAASYPAVLKACRARREKCKRSVISGEILFPFSDEFTDYDYTKDKLISYEEFVFTIMERFPMAAPEELREPFIFADVNDDDYMDMDEFKGAPFLFAHYNLSKKKADQTNQMVN